MSVTERFELFLSLSPLATTILGPLSGFIIIKLLQPFVKFRHAFRAWLIVSYVIMLIQSAGYYFMTAGRLKWQ